MVYTGTPRRGASPQTLRSRGYLPGSGGSSSRKKLLLLRFFSLLVAALLRARRRVRGMIDVIRTDFYGWIFNIDFPVIIKAAAAILTNQGEHKVLPGSCRGNAGGLSQTSRRCRCARPSSLPLVAQKRLAYSLQFFLPHLPRQCHSTYLPRTFLGTISVPNSACINLESHHS